MPLLWKKDSASNIWCDKCECVGYCSEACKASDWQFHQTRCNPDSKIFVNQSKQVFERAFKNTRFGCLARSIFHLNHQRDLLSPTNNVLKCFFETYHHDTVFSCLIKQYPADDNNININTDPDRYYFNIEYIGEDITQMKGYFGTYSLSKTDCQNNYHADKLEKIFDPDDLQFPINIIFSDDFCWIRGLVLIILNKTKTEQDIDTILEQVHGQIVEKYNK